MKVKEKGVQLTYGDNMAIVSYTPTMVRKEGMKVKKAVLVLPMQICNNDEGFVVNCNNKVIDSFITFGSNNCVAIDIKEELQKILDNDLEVLNLEIINANTDNFVVLEEGKEVVVNYVSKKTKECDNFIEEKLTSKARSEINLNNGQLLLSHSDLNGISHEYNSFNDGCVLLENEIYQLPDNGCGKGFKLNLEQYLIKECKEDGLLSDKQSASRFIYVDDKGQESEFLDKYYYLEDDNRMYIDPSVVEIDLDGKLTYMDQEVKKESITNSGLTLVSDLDNFVGKELLKQESELDALTLELDDLLTELEQYAYQREEIRAEEFLLKLEEKIKANEKLIQDKNLIHEQYNIDIQKMLSTYKKEYLNNEVIYLTKLRNRAYNDNVTYDPEEKLAKTNVDYNYENIEHLNITSMDENTSVREYIYDINRIMNIDNSAYVTHQNSYKKNKYKYSAAALDYYKKRYSDLVKKKRKEIKDLELYNPVHYLIDENDNVYGFAKTDDEKVFRLTYINDSSGNIFYLRYENNRLSLVSKDNNKLMEFKYENNKLIRIKDFKNRKISFNYDGDYLKEVIYQNNKRCLFDYDSNGLLKEITTESNNGYEFEYIDDKLTKINRIKDNIKNTKKEITYVDDNTTYTTDVKTGDVISYIFDNDFKLVTTYRNKFEDNGVIANVEVISYEFVSDKKSLSVSDFSYKEELLDDISYEGYNHPVSELYLGDELYGGEVSLTSFYDDKENDLVLVGTEVNKLEKVLTREQLLSLTDSKKLIFSGWCKANSLFVAPRLSGFSGDLVSNDDIDMLLMDSSDIQKANRKFELRCEVQYLSRREEYCASFDCYNNNWQYCALPISLSDDDTLIDIKLIFDYSNNLGEAYFSKMSLKEGKWEYQEYEDTLVTYYESSDKEEVVRYEYEDKLLCREILSKDNEEYITTYKYDLDNNLSEINYLFNDLINKFEYDEEGNLIKSYVYSKYDPSLRIYQDEIMVNEDGAIENVNEYGFKLVDNNEVGYDEESNLIIKRKDKTCNEREYDDNGNVIRLRHNDFDYEYEYDDENRIVKIFVAGNLYLENSYDEEANVKKITTSYGNGDTYISYYNKEDEIIKIECLKDGVNSVLVENVYDKHQNMISSNDMVNEIVDSFEYDKYNQIVRKKTTRDNKEYIVGYSYQKEKLIADSYSHDGVVFSNEYQYDQNDNVVELKLNNVVNEVITRDRLSRMKEIELENVYRKKFDYLLNKDHTGELLDKEEFIFSNGRNEGYRYEYDKNLNITCIKFNEEEVVSYKYDELSRLIREDNKLLNKSVEIVYDNGGNIISRNEGVYLKDEPVVGSKIVYNYNRDYLMNFDGFNFSYNALGYPLVYKNKNLVWNNKNLMSFDGVEFSYDSNSLRLSKKQNNVITKYYYDEEKLRVEDNGNVLYYHYDLSGVIGFTYNNVGTYFYKKNILGDIIGILNSNNEEIVKYVYDAYGNHDIYVLDNSNYIRISDDVALSNEGLNNKLISHINPFRYRGYYFDKETGLYYLVNRYYDPLIGRFISPDNLNCLDFESFNGLNLYCYCLNNPINNVDPNGEISFKWYHWLTLGIGVVFSLAVIGGVVGIASGYIAPVSAMAAGIMSAFKGMAYVGLAGGVAGSAIGAATSMIKGTDVVDGMAKGAVFGYTIGAIGGGLLLGMHGFYNFYPRKITKFTRHAKKQMMIRDGGRGVQKSALEYSVKHDLHPTVSKINRNVYIYKTKRAVTIMHKNGSVRTGYAKSSKYWQNPMKDLILGLFGLKELFDNN